VLLVLATSAQARPRHPFLAPTVQALAVAAALGSLGWAGY